MSTSLPTRPAGLGHGAVPHKYAELRLRDRETTIGLATYHHAGGFGFNKWASTESKMRPVIDELLAAY